MKKCKEGHYYCFQDSKCKPIPKGYRRGVGGYLRREREDEKEDSKENGNGNGKSNGSSNGNGNGGNGGGNGNGGSGGNGGGNGSGGVGESFETIQNSDGNTTAVVVDIIGPAHMKPKLNDEGVWKGTNISEVLNPSQFLGALKKAKIMSRSSKMNQAMVDADKTNGNPNLTKTDSKVTEVGDQPSMGTEPMEIAKRKYTGKLDPEVLKQNPDLDPTKPRDYIKLKRLSPKIDKAHYESEGELVERKMTEKEKRKDDRLKKKYDKSDMKKSMQKQYGKEEGKKVYFATIRKQAMEEEKHKDHEPEMIRNQLKTAANASKRIKKHTLKKDNFKAWVQSKVTKATDYLDTAADYLDGKDDMKEELNKKDKPYIKKLVKNLRKGSKTHAKQADKLEKAMNEGAINPNKFSDSAMPKLPGLGGGGGGTDAITMKATGKSLGKRIKDVGKLSTVPARFLLNIKSKPDPTEKFADSNMTPKEKVSSAISNFKRGLGEESNPRIPRKKGQPANSKKHSDLYTDENPKGTIHGLGFKDVATAKASVSKIRKSNRSHAHKIQAAVAMEQRAREMGKTSEAAVYRKFINSMKKKTKK